MCGILGFILQENLSSHSLQQSLLKGIESITHRGPDDRGLFVDKNFGLAHVRLSILDLSSAAKQPMVNNSGRFIISYNGEVYNYQDLITEFNFSNLNSRSDTEVILRAFEASSKNIFLRLNGMFAFALADLVERKLWLVRDRLGIKPLFYKATSEGIWFASEIKALFAMIEPTTPLLNDEAVHEWSYFGNSLGRKTLYKDVYRLLPGHYLEINMDSLDFSENSYWSINKKFTNTLNKECNNNILIDKTKNLLEQAVKRQLISDVPVGIFLSGGIDSSAITAFASKHYEHKLATYSVAFDFQKDSELKYARVISQKFGTSHNEIHIKGTDIGYIVEKMIHHHDAPFSDAANIPLYLLCNEIKGTAKVILQGDGGDELFGGYQRYVTLSKLQKMKLYAYLGRALNKLSIRNIGFYRRQRYINALLTSDPSLMMAMLLTVEDSAFSPLQMFDKNYQNKFKKFDAFMRYREIEEKLSSLELVNRMLCIDKSIILPDIFLEKVDRSSMAASIEVRVPFLDNDLVDFCLSLSSRQKLDDGKQKWLLKKSLQGILPDDILCGKKRGFGVPFEAWIKSSLANLFHDHISLFNRKNPGVLDMFHVTKIYDDHKNLRRDHGFMLWKILNFIIWINNNGMVLSNEI